MCRSFFPNKKKTFSCSTNKSNQKKKQHLFRIHLCVYYMYLYSYKRSTVNNMQYKCLRWRLRRRRRNYWRKKKQHPYISYKCTYYIRIYSYIQIKDIHISCRVYVVHDFDFIGLYFFSCVHIFVSVLSTMHISPSHTALLTHYMVHCIQIEPNKWTEPTQRTKYIYLYSN